MLQLVLFVLFFTLHSAQPSLENKNILSSSGKILNYENSPSTFICTKTNAIWIVNNVKVTECNCPGKCGNVIFDKTRITAYCNGSSPVLHFKQMKLDDNNKPLKCVSVSSWNFRLLVGRKNDDFYPKEPLALVNNNYALVCQKEKGQQVYLYDDKKYIGMIYSDNYIENMDKENFVITADQSKITLFIKKVALKDDGKIFGCLHIGNHLSLLNLTVNVPVSSVSLHQKIKDFLIEDETKIFVCKVDESKPKASFQWILSENGSEREITENIDITSKQKGKVWQTNSTLKLKLKRNFTTIKCRAKIQGMAWTNFKSLPLDVKYPPPGKPKITVNNSQICVGELIRIRCEWKGGHPNATVNLTCLSQTKNQNQNYVTITETVTREMSNHCRCEGKHMVKNTFDTYNLSIQYPPNKVVIDQTSYLKGKPSSLICDAVGGSQDVYTYSWSPGNYPSQKKININLTQVSNQEFTCTVTYKCEGGDLKSEPTKIIVEDDPIIKMPNRITVIENETMEFKCITEGNPEPTNMWRINNKIINSTLLKTSFTRHNATGGIQCIAIANSIKHGILKTVKNISILVTYAPEITISYDNSEIRCSANASPGNITYELVQKWGTIEKQKYEGKQTKKFQNLAYKDSGEWICRATNGVLTKTKKKYSEKSVQVKANVSAKFNGDRNNTEEAIIGHKKQIKVCFYCHPKAKVVKWHSEGRPLSSDKSVYSPAEKGLFPFTGNCTTLTLDITEKSAKNYELTVKNDIGTRKYSVNLVFKEEDFNYLMVVIPIVVLLLLIICAGIGFYKYRSYTKEKESKNNLVDNNNSGNDMMENSLYSGVTNNAATDIEPLYAQVDKAPKKLSKRTNANIEDLYAKVDKSKKSPNKNATDIEPLYAQVDKAPKKLSKRTNENVEDLYAKVDKSKKPQNQNPNVEDLYAQVDKSKKPQNKNSNVEDLYAQVDKSKKPEDKNVFEGNNSLYANVDEIVPDKKAKKKVAKKNPPVPAKPKLKSEPAKDIYENLEMQQKKTDGNQELMYADLDFLEKGSNKQKPVKKEEEETMYAAIDFSDMETH